MRNTLLVLCFICSLKAKAQLEDLSINNVKRINGDTVFFSKKLYSISKSFFFCSDSNYAKEKKIFSLADGLWSSCWLLNKQFLIIGFIDNSRAKNSSLVPVDYKYALFVNYEDPEKVFAYWDKSKRIFLTDILMLDIEKGILKMKDEELINVKSVVSPFIIDNNLNIRED